MKTQLRGLKDTERTQARPRVRDSSGLSRSRTVVGKVAVEAVENCPSSTLLTSFVLHPYI
jgi:hypothetical protein